MHNIIHKAIIEEVVVVDIIGVELVETTSIEVAAVAGTIAEIIMTTSIPNISVTIGAVSPTNNTEEKMEEIT